MSTMQTVIEKLAQEHNLPDGELLKLITSTEADTNQLLAAAADKIRQQYYGKKVYIRGLIEFTNYCKNNCYYCGIRAGNAHAQRYRLSKEQILDCCAEGYKLGFRTFVLQGGEDPYFTDERICEIVAAIRQQHPDCAITLSIGEKEKASYQAYFEAGANRYLLRHETADAEHYAKLHPASMSLANRKRCLFDLKEIGYQVGSGFMVGSPYQTPQNLLADLRFLQKLQPDMIGIGPYITHEQTPFADKKSGTAEQTLRMLSILRLMFPYALLPSTTALGTIHPNGRELGLKAGGNVVMPNLSPVNVRKLYELYENKICTGEEAAQCRGCLEARVRLAGYEIVTDRGDVARNVI
ncbi:MAG: [FeFe] hydrogenase H-cluster radical SAM maturase HydE [Phascolarctobacterium sp.]|nr:[FeFe] hydrogenase H-cluster radical SAM maturase HydE [Phascolarctobacterium sp.]